MKRYDEFKCVHSETLDGIIIFADIALQPNETKIDFSRNPFPPGEEKLGTIRAELAARFAARLFLFGLFFSPIGR